MTSLVAELGTAATAAEFSTNHEIDAITPVHDPVPHSTRARGVTYDLANAATYGIHKLLAFLDGSQKAPTSPYLTGNYAPVREELFKLDLPVEGALPRDLSGAFARTGPNPYFDPVSRYHWFDGDGMIHAVRIRDGRAAYCNRYVDTARLREEKAAGYAAAGKFGDYRGKLFGMLHIFLDLLKKKLGVISTEDGIGTGNTALAFHAGKLLALHEGDLPYALRIACNGIVSTLGRMTFGGNLEQKTFTAHPKVDPQTGELFSFSYSVEKAPYLWFHRLDRNGKVLASFPVPGMRGPIMMHDCALTERHMLFIEAPLFFKPEEIMKSGTLPFVFEKTQNLRVGVLDRYATDGAEVKWFDLPPCMVFHTANAWEVNNSTIELYLCAFNDFTLDELAPVQEDSEPHLTRVFLDLTAGSATFQRLAPLAGDFPVVPASLMGRRSRYAYVATFETSESRTALFNGIAKLDLTAAGPETAVDGVIRHGQGRLGGEAYFVPRKDGTDEDDGYLLTYVWDEKLERSELVVYDAASMASSPVARVILPARVPYGFHGTWVSEEQVKNQIL